MESNIKKLDYKELSVESKQVVDDLLDIHNLIKKISKKYDDDNIRFNYIFVSLPIIKNGEKTEINTMSSTRIKDAFSAYLIIEKLEKIIEEIIKKIES